MITLKVKIADTLVDKIVGLTGKKEGEALLIRTRFGIHTFGLSFPLDILILDRNYKVVKLKINLRVNKLFFWNPKYDMIVELPAGTVVRKRIRIGDKINLISGRFGTVNSSQ